MQPSRWHACWPNLAEEHRTLTIKRSNGIRFSISDLSSPTARIMPTIYQDRCGISLYDAQYSTGEKGPIPPTVVQEVLVALLRFKTTCQDYGVPDTHIRVVATEATREALNSIEYRQAIQDRTGWKVELLSKEAEGRIGAIGVASSFSSVKGLVMDLGGGSTQLTWLIAEHGNVRTSPKGAVSLPYGAAALTLRLAEAERAGGDATDRLRAEMKAQLQQAYTDLALPPELTDHATGHDGLSLYLSGGGFRGWGYLLMAQHRVQPYPIPIINGFHAPRTSFQDTLQTQTLASSTAPIFRVSTRRASQVPAVAFLISVLSDALPPIKEALFSQGGVREGLLYTFLPPAVRAAHPLVTATAPYASPNASPAATFALRVLLAAAIPDVNIPAPHTAIRTVAHPPFLQALANSLHLHAPLPSESRAASALRATTTGVLTAAHGLSHTDRALLALALCERWGGEGQIAPTDEDFLARTRALVGDELSWWTKYVGAVAGLVGEVYPGGLVRVGEERMEVEGRWKAGVKGKSVDEVGIEVVVRVREGEEGSAEGGVRALEKVGKRKNWVGGKERYGFRVGVVVRRDL